MTYITTNPHGSYTEFKSILEMIDFGKDDVMFILGDLVDIGEDPMELLSDLTFRENIWAIAGEHDALARDMLSGFEKMLKSGETPDDDYRTGMLGWMADGGKVTFDAYRALDEDMREGVLDYLNELPAYETLSVAGQEYLLLHSGITGYKPGIDLDDYPPEAFWGNDPTRKIDGVTVVCGHIPTNGFFDGDGRIYHGDGFVAVDCGAARGGRLGCICLDDGREFYA